ncbi:hypothetical protein DRO22_03260 [Candidatus Bathyarchaeota archaeon]|nr:MAG: hypothetical protein DRO22_03260 [Candidatus Bathyarchaeota archaeon]
MKLIVGSDFHGNEVMIKRFAAEAVKENAEAMLICGDLTNFGSLKEATRLLSILSETGVPVLFIPGNCDPPSLLGANLEGVKLLHGEATTYGELSFIGIGGSPPTPFHTPFELSEEEIIAELERAAEDITDYRRLILISHSPPHGTQLDRTMLHLHVGSLSIRRFIEENEPLLVFCGHIHEAKGEDKIKSTTIVNPGPAKDGDYVLALVKKNNISIEFRSLYD